MYKRQGVTINEFFTQEDAPAQVVFGEEDYFEKIDEELGNKTEWIIPNAQKNMMEPIRMTLEAGGSTYPDNPHEGEELGYVLRGEITIIIGKEKHRAKAGEAFYYTPDKKHYITSKTVSYTHLDVYKRQLLRRLSVQSLSSW